jgi:hypothetical protein
VQHDLYPTHGLKITANPDDGRDATPYNQDSGYTYAVLTNAGAAGQTHAAFPVKDKGNSMAYLEYEGLSKKQRPKLFTRQPPKLSRRGDTSPEHAVDKVSPFYYRKSDDTAFRSAWNYPPASTSQNASVNESHDIMFRADLGPPAAFGAFHWSETSSVTTAPSHLDSDSLFEDNVGGRITPDSMSAIQESVLEEPKEMEEDQSQDLPTEPQPQVLPAGSGFVVEPSSKFQPGSVRNTPILLKR